MIERPKLSRIIIGDDDEEDVFAIRRAFAKLDNSIELHHLADGAAAVDYLLSVTAGQDGGSLAAAQGPRQLLR